MQFKKSNADPLAALKERCNDHIFGVPTWAGLKARNTCAVRSHKKAILYQIKTACRFESNRKARQGQKESQVVSHPALHANTLWKHGLQKMCTWP